MKPNVCGAIAEQLVIPLRSLVKLVCGLHIIEEKKLGIVPGSPESGDRDRRLDLS